VKDRIEIGDVRCPPGERCLGRLTCGYLEDSSPVDIPLIVLNGVADGPILWLGATVHGMEIAGVEVIRRVTREEVDPGRLRGAILAAPILNPIAYRFHSYHSPKDGLNMNRVYPGDANESLTHRMAHAVFTQGIVQCDCAIDFHANPAGAIDYLFVRVGEGEAWRRGLEMAAAYGITIVESIPRRSAYGHEERLTGLLADAAAESGRPALTVELTPMYRLDDTSIRSGVRGTLNVMKFLGMLDGLPEPQLDMTVIKDRIGPQLRVTATKGGLLHYLVPVASWVQSGQPLLDIRDPWGDVVETIKSPADGYVLAYGSYGNQAAASGDIVAFVAPRRL
jgi:predicted deacylase